MSIKKEMLDSTTTKDKGKAAILPFSTLLLTEPCYQLLQPPQPLWVWVDRTSINSRKLNLHVDVGGRVKASIKRRGKQFRKGGTRTKN